ncbi:MAG: OmpA family protein [Prevotellaceae bacterium]|jgi:peptidoglycan-associated lipoprotein|nr:OmpA family protein [Prevotellaceae bacterium]
MLLALSSCTVKQKLAMADKAYDQQAYARAAKRYAKVQPKISRSKDPATYYRVLFHLAEGSRLTGDTRRAEGLYERSILKSNPNPNAVLGLAKAQQANEKFAEAANTYAEYLKLIPQDSATQKAMEFCIALRDTAVKQTRYLVEPVTDFNSNKDDFAPSFAEDDYSVVYFTSARDAAMGNKRRKSIITGEKMTDIFFAKQARTGRWEKIQPVEGEINTKSDEGANTFSRNLQKMYFTQCLTKGATPGCRICTATRGEENIWTEVEQLYLADSTANAAHPTLADDETVLYFTSDMEGGHGGFDIWMVNRLSADEGWGEPTNLGKDINSAADEFYPYMRPNGVLYFSSNGMGGYGGLDIFKATKKQEGGWHVENMGMPMNSAADDFSIIFEREGEAGYFASRRRAPKVKGGDDIFRFVLPEAKFTFVGSVREADEGTPIDQANVSVITSGGESTKYNTEKDGIFTLQLQPETDYLVRVSKSGYFNQKARFSTKGLEEITTLRDEFLMRSMAKAVELENILYDFGKYTLRPESEESLNGLVEVLNDNPSIIIEIASHSDSRGDSTFNMELSQKRAQSVVDYLVGKGISAERLEAKGYGATKPRTVSKSVAAQYKFMREGDVLSDDFLRKNVRTQQEEDAVDQLNRRTEFQVISGVR